MNMCFLALDWLGDWIWMLKIGCFSGRIWIVPKSVGGTLWPDGKMRTGEPLSNSIGGQGGSVCKAMFCLKAFMSPNCFWFLASVNRGPEGFSLLSYPQHASKRPFPFLVAFAHVALQESRRSLDSTGWFAWWNHWAGLQLRRESSTHLWRGQRRLVDL